jgi:hypothetical protein
LLTPFKNCFKELKDKPWHVEVQTMRNGCDYVNVVVHVFQTQIREYYNIENCGRCKITAIKQILKKERRMAKDNNPTPNKFKVSPLGLYRYTAYLLFISFITGSSVYKNHQA